jgi:hypothetical protein
MNPKPLSRTALLSRTLVRFLAGLFLVGCMLFLPAGTLRYWEAWLYMALLFVPVAVVGGVLFIKDPELLERRLRTQERELPRRKSLQRRASFSYLCISSRASTGGMIGRPSRPPSCC